MVTHDPEAASYADRLWCCATAASSTTPPPARADQVIELMKDACVGSPSAASRRASCARSLTALAVFLGVALIAGTYVLTDTINASFDQIFSESLKGTDVVVIAARGGQAATTREPPAFPASLLPQVQAVARRRAAAGAIFSLGRVVERQGRHDRRTAARPNFIASALPRRFETLTYVKGRPPRTATETSLDKQTADTGKLPRRRRGSPSPARRASSCYQHRRDRRSSATSLVRRRGDRAADPARGAALTDKVGKFDQISVPPRPGVSPERAGDADPRACCRRRVNVRDRASRTAERQSEDIAEQLYVPHDRAARVRRRRAVRRRVPDLQHVLDHRRPAHRASSGCCARSAPRAARCSRRWSLEALVIGAASARRSAWPAGSLSRQAINALFKAVGIDLPNTGTVIERAR